VSASRRCCRSWLGVATNPYGKDPAQIAETLEYLETVEPLLREAATLEVVTTVPVGQVADMVVAYCL